MAQPDRYVNARDYERLTPVHVVWEITLACDLKCHHCGSRAGRRRPDELTTEECFDLIRQLARMGTREISLIGGEAYLRRDWLHIVREIRAQGMNCAMQTGALHMDEKRVRQAAEAGVQSMGVSIDGLEETHDRLRGVKGSYAAGFEALRLLRQYGIVSSVNTQITSLVIPQLRELMERFIEAGAKNWQVQLTVAMGRAADNPELLLQPHQLRELMPLLAELYREGVERGLLMQPGNNVGYFGPYESLWRGSGDQSIHWQSCNAGTNTMGIEADGTIKGCPSLTTSPYAGGNVREMSVEDIWFKAPELSFTRVRTQEDLWGFCRTCYYADVCRAGCTWTTQVLFGRPGNNPFCHHRVLELSKRGLRERIERVEPAPGKPFDHGRFELILETEDGRPVADGGETDAALNAEPNGRARAHSSLPLGRDSLVQISSAKKSAFQKVSPHAPEVQQLSLCRGCECYVRPDTRLCPHCGGNVRALERAHRKKAREAREAAEDLLKLIGM
ncbi:MAG TPA: GDL motif peptide-associated radical SAM/SPASM maturase [Pyrinomonadaceae bacterium]|nr:GDL motif peptide-associated radical SAM/SPASM maturase [Pyrinomonadaceae bacterium]